MNMIEYRCPKCQERYVISNYQLEKNDSSIPSPDKSMFMRKFQDHGDHTIFLRFDDDGELMKYQILPQLRSVFDTFLFDNIQVAAIINTILDTKKYDKRRLLLYITESQSFFKFFREITKKYTEAEKKVTIKKEEGFMLISLSHLDFILANFDIAKKIIDKGYGSFDYLKNLNTTKLGSMVIDTSITEEKKMLKMIKKGRLKLDSDVRIILAFDSRRTKVPPFDIREYFLDKFSSNSLELLNFQDTNGLKSIFLQSYYNILEDPLEGRETFEIIQRPY